MDEAKIREKIESGILSFLGAFSKALNGAHPVGRLRIYCSLNGINHSFYRFDDSIYFAPRQLASDKLVGPPIPTLVFSKTHDLKSGADRPRDIYSWLIRDFEFLLCKPRDAALYFDSSNVAPNAAVFITNS